MKKYSTNLEQQEYLMKLFVNFHNKVENATILQAWNSCNQIFYDTYLRLKAICSNNINELNVFGIIFIIVCDKNKR
ncbi:hypothetical protein RFI_05896 [Reticulomyxa filosa]|uniref:Uncharacterized protein n=1 Tax=Reticulomyxa filosa TaxID=46433 RepID=X6NZB3_RETFI|nr:hypothetical protein RFI_05896 [Reticulomyxa filosa]|eukprot:ETO31223.1 hypothetical protein RFI_05896 [Reticulomyxa filosa]